MVAILENPVQDDLDELAANAPAAVRDGMHQLKNFDTDTTAEALSLSGLNWEVATRRLFYAAEGGEKREIPGQRAVVRQDTGGVHGVVSDRYTPIQNGEISAVLDPLLSAGRFRVKQGGITARNRCWLISESPRIDDITGRGDEIRHFLMAHWRHDGKTAIRADFVANRVACSNAIQRMFDYSRKDDLGVVFNINHGGNYRYVMNLVSATLQAQAESSENLVTALKEMAKTKLLQPRGFFENLLSEPVREKLTERGFVAAVRRRNATIQEMERLYEEGLGRDLRENGTAWAAYCAATECADHYLTDRLRANSDAFEYRWFGGGSELRVEAFRQAVALAA